MVVILPDSTRDLWRLCHNLARLLGVSWPSIPHLVVRCAQYFGLKLQPYVPSGFLFGMDFVDTPPLEVVGTRVYGRAAISPANPGPRPQPRQQDLV